MTTEMTDEEFLEAFERLEVAKEDFHHRDHLRLAWACLRGATERAALARVREAICRFADKHGVPHLYHETITRFWVTSVATAMRAATDAPDFATLAVRHPQLLDKELVRRRYRPETLASERAKAGWIEPDA
jgi:hypothetical protein